MSHPAFRIRIQSSFNTDENVFDSIFRSFRIFRSTPAFAHTIHDHSLIVLVQHYTKKADNVITSTINTLINYTLTDIITTYPDTLSPKEEKEPGACSCITHWKQAPEPKSHAPREAKTGTSHEAAISSTPFIATPWTQWDHQCRQATPSVHEEGEETKKDCCSLCNHPWISTIQPRPLPWRPTI